MNRDYHHCDWCPLKIYHVTKSDLVMANSREILPKAKDNQAIFLNIYRAVIYRANLLFGQVHNGPCALPLRASLNSAQVDACFSLSLLSHGPPPTQPSVDSQKRRRGLRWPSGPFGGLRGLRTWRGKIRRAERMTTKMGTRKSEIVAKNVATIDAFKRSYRGSNAGYQNQNLM